MNSDLIKRSYNPPQVERVKLDNEISLVLQSIDDNPIIGPEEETLASNNLNNDPFNTNMVVS